MQNGFLSAQVADPAYQLGPDLLAAQKLPTAPVAGMAFGGEGGPDPSKFDIMVGDDFGVWQNKTMESSSEVPVEQSGIPGYEPFIAFDFVTLPRSCRLHCTRQGAPSLATDCNCCAQNYRE